MWVLEELVLIWVVQELVAMWVAATYAQEK